MKVPKILSKKVHFFVCSKVENGVNRVILLLGVVALLKNCNFFTSHPELMFNWPLIASSRWLIRANNRCMELYDALENSQHRMGRHKLCIVSITIARSLTINWSCSNRRGHRKIEQPDGIVQSDGSSRWRSATNVRCRKNSFFRWTFIALQKFFKTLFNGYFEPKLRASSKLRIGRFYLPLSSNPSGFAS